MLRESFPFDFLGGLLRFCGGAAALDLAAGFGGAVASDPAAGFGGAAAAALFFVAGFGEAAALSSAAAAGFGGAAFDSVHVLPRTAASDTAAGFEGVVVLSGSSRCTILFTQPSIIKRSFLLLLYRKNDGYISVLGIILINRMIICEVRTINCK